MSARCQHEQKTRPRRIVIAGDPVPKPRMTVSDAWRARPCVLRYRAWCDRARLAAFGKNRKLRLATPTSVIVRVWIDDTTTQHRVGPHGQKPDIDNCLKAVLDALFENDEFVYDVTAKKLWADGSSPRVEVEWR